MAGPRGSSPDPPGVSQPGDGATGGGGSGGAAGAAAGAAAAAARRGAGGAGGGAVGAAAGARAGARRDAAAEPGAASRPGGAEGEGEGGAAAAERPLRGPGPWRSGQARRRERPRSPGVRSPLLPVKERSFGPPGPLPPLPRCGRANGTCWGPERSAPGCGFQRSVSLTSGCLGRAGCLGSFCALTSCHSPVSRSLSSCSVSTGRKTTLSSRR